MRSMSSLLVTHFPNENYEEGNYDVLTIQPQRTLIEKIFLLHEEYNRDEVAKMRTERISRHYYDLFQLSRQDFSLSTHIPPLRRIGYLRRVWSATPFAALLWAELHL